MSDAVEPWRRLSPRMLLIHPIVELGKAIPIVIAALFAGSSGGGQYLGLGIAVLVVLLAVTRWFTTRYRIDDMQIQLRHGLLRRRTVSARLDRVRTVDVTAHLMHRLLGLTRVTIGTGTSDRRRPEGITLDGVEAAAAARLRVELLHRAPSAAEPAVSPPEQDLATFDPAWVRFAPFNLSGALTALAVLGFGVRVVNDAHINVAKLGAVRNARDEVSSTSIAVAAVVAVIAILAFVALTSTVGYLLAFWGFHLTRHEGGSLHVSRGLITTRNTSIERRRLRGVELSEPLPLRLVGGARCLALATGLRVGRGAERGGSLLLPPAPRDAAVRVCAAVIANADPIVQPLVGHGPVARRRRYIRSVGLTLTVLLVVLVAGAATHSPVQLWFLALLLVPAAALAEDRSRGLGHGLISRHLVARSGSIVRRRVVLAEDGVIGWNMRRTFFQRRQGLMTLTATTAAGRQGYHMIDIGLGEAESVILACSPGLLDGVRC